MNQGKYSPNLPNRDQPNIFYDRNAKGEIPPEYVVGQMEFVEEIHFADYDPEGYDRYGYSAYDSEGNFVGTGNGVDRNGYTEFEYLVMSTREFEDF